MRSRFINRGVGVACASLLAGGAVANANGLASLPGAVIKRASPRAGAGLHHGKRASTRHAKKKASNRGPRGPRGAQGTAGLQGGQGMTGAQGPQGPQGPQIPGASKFFFSESPAVADPIHPVIPIGPIQFGVSCQPGASEGEVVLGFSTTIPSPISWTTVTTVSGTGEATTSSVYDASTAVPVPPQTSLKFVKAKRQTGPNRHLHNRCERLHHLAAGQPRRGRWGKLRPVSLLHERHRALTSRTWSARA
jgi:hypothetical protein